MLYPKKVLNLSRELKARYGEVSFLEEGVSLLLGDNNTLYLLDIAALLSSGAEIMFALFQRIFPNSNRRILMDSTQIEKLQAKAYSHDKEAARAQMALQELGSLQTIRPDALANLEARNGRPESLMDASKDVIDQASPDTPVIVLTTNRDLATYANAMRIFRGKAVLALFPQDNGFVRHNTTLPKLLPIPSGAALAVELRDTAPVPPYHLEGTECALSLGQQLGRPGGEGTCYEAADDPDTVYKIFHCTFDPADPYSDKLRKMSQLGLQTQSMDICLPTGVLADATGSICGIRMRRLSGVTLEELFLNPQSLSDTFKNRLSIFELATDVFVAVYRLVYNQILPFDLKLSNIMIDLQTRKPTLFDLDSCQFKNYPGLTFSEETRSPSQQQSTNLRTTLRGYEDLKFTVWAVMFQLLHMGLGQYDSSPNEAEKAFIFEKDIPIEGYEQQLTLFKNLSRDTQRLFRQALAPHPNGSLPELSQLYVMLIKEQCLLRSSDDEETNALWPRWIHRSRKQAICSRCGNAHPINYLAAFQGGLLLCNECRNLPMPYTCSCSSSLDITLGAFLVAKAQGKGLPVFCKNCTITKQMMGESEGLVRPIDDHDNQLAEKLLLPNRFQRPSPITRVAPQPERPSEPSVRTYPDPDYSRRPARQPKASLWHRILNLFNP